MWDPVLYPQESLCSREEFEGGQISKHLMH